MNSPAKNTDSRAERSFWLALVAICVLGGIFRVLIVTEYLANNPFSYAPRVDAQTYWNWAGRIAAGHLRESTPFFSAPLYPYWVGLNRACGGSLATVYTAQIGLDLLTAVLIGCIGRRRFGAGVGLGAAAIFLLMLEPASFALRILTCSLQLTLVCLMWLALLRAQDRPTLWRRSQAGLAAGLLSLSYPPAMLLLPGLGVWFWWNSQRAARDAGRALIPVVLGMAVISPATIHNYLASGEFFAIQSVSGITLRQGNGPGATGTIVMIPGTSIDRELLFSTAQSAYQRETGKPGTWGEINRHYRDQAIDYWRSDIGRAFRLFARKFYLFLTGRNFADIYNPEWEIDEGLDSRLQLAPLRTSWLVLPAIAALAVWARRPNRFAPELALFALALLVVIVFRFSPRYRLPCIPVLALGAAWAVHALWQWRASPRTAILVVVSVVLTGGLAAVNRAMGFDSLDPLRAELHQSLGVAYADTNKPELAEKCYRQSLEENPNMAAAHAALGQVLQRRGEMREALDHLRRAIEIEPLDPTYRNNLGNALANMGALAQARDQFAAAVYNGPGFAVFESNLANVLLQLGEYADAKQHYERALELEPTSAVTHYNLAYLCQVMSAPDEALKHYEQARQYDPTLAPAHFGAGQILSGKGMPRAALKAFLEAHRLAPDKAEYTNGAAWGLATIGDTSLRDPKRAIELAELAAKQHGSPDPQLMDTLAAALAADGQFNRAIETAQAAIPLAEQQGNKPLADEIRARIKLYQSNKAYVEPTGS